MRTNILLFTVIYMVLIAFVYYLYNIKLKKKTQYRVIKILGVSVRTKTLINNFIYISCVEAFFLLFLFYVVK